MTPQDADGDGWIEASVASRGSRLEIRQSEGGSPPAPGQGSDGDPTDITRRSLRSGASRRLHRRALSGLRRIQLTMGCAMLLSAAAGAYLLATDGSLWHLAVSHAVGLIVMVALDLVLGTMNLIGSKRVYLATLAGALLGVVLQLGDITTAPQYDMSMRYFASYLFGLPAFDAQLALQLSVLVLGVFGRGYVQSLALHRREGKELSYSRRNFMKTIAGFGTLIGLGVVLGSIKLPPPAPATTSTTTSSSRSPGQTRSPALLSTAPGAIANANNMQPGSYVTFQYPRGFPNVLFKRADGSLAAYSLLCTHVCCECVYEPSANLFFCPCHGSEFDSNGRVIRGPAAAPLPSVSLNVDASGNVYPTGTVGYTPC